MSPGFAIWLLVMVVIVGVMSFVSRRSRRVDDKTEQTAASALPEIGDVAEKMHQASFGRAPTVQPTSGTWYPPKAKQPPARK